MNKYSMLLSILALSVGLTCSVLTPVATALPLQVPSESAIPSLAPVLENVLPAVVNIKVECTALGNKHIPDEQAQLFTELGSGVIIDAAKGYVLTNNHLINQAQKISV